MTATMVPQKRKVLLSSENSPIWIRRLNDNFPENQRLTEEEEERLSAFLDAPAFVSVFEDWKERLQAKELLLRLVESEEVKPEQIISYYYQPWRTVIPKTSCVRRAIEHGEQLRADIKQAQEKHDLNLYNNTVDRYQRRVYSKETFRTILSSRR